MSAQPVRVEESADTLAEREACASLAESMYSRAVGITHMTVAAETIAAAIRARGVRPLTKAGPR